MADGVLLKLTGVSKSYPGVQALDSVDFDLRAGEVHSLMGENGAGKSTLIKVLTGVTSPDSGRFELAGQDIRPRSPLEAQQIGISTVYQEVNLVTTLSVAENLVLGREPKVAGQIRWSQARKMAEEALARLGIEVDVRQTLGSCSIAIRQMVAIARALAINESPKVLILDEPTSSLDANEVEQLFTVMRRLRDSGLGIVFVSHFLDQIYAITDRITVLRNGKKVGCYETAGLPRLELIGHMIGKTPSEAAAIEAGEKVGKAAASEPVLKAEGLKQSKAVCNVSLELRKGEVVGLAGLLGSGRSETARLLFGVDRLSSGAITLGGRKNRTKSPRKAISAGLGFLPEDRKAEGIFPNLSLRDNIAIALQCRQGWLRPLSFGQRQELADRYIKALRIATPDAAKPIGQLSGGNQQKALLARWLAAQPEILLLDEPTRGIDVGARAELDKEIGRLAEQGLAILLICSELEEITRASHRVVVLRDGVSIAEIPGEEATVDRLISTIAHG